MGTRMLIGTQEDWPAFRDAFRDSVILDPTIVRIADLFLSGAPSFSPHDRPRIWEIIRGNVGALAAFFDAIITYPTVPLIGYEASYGGRPPEWYADLENQPLPAALASCAEVLKPVSIFYDANGPLYADAMEKMSEGTEIPPQLAIDLEAGLRSLNWEWKPGILEQPSSMPAGNQRLTNAFLYSGLMFSSYAKEIYGDQLLSPELSKLFAAAAVGEESFSNAANEEAAFKGLSDRWNESNPDFPRSLRLTTPSFLPYLLRSDPSSIGKLVEEALKMRDERGVGEYRGWRHELREDLAKGRISSSKRRDVEAVSVRYARQLAPTGDYSMTWNFSVSSTGPAIGVGGTLHTAPLRDWLMDMAPGKRYQKLLVRLAEASGEYFSPDLHLKQLWEAA
jgi:hypothetical protein